jgi:hypothetical protein
VPAGCPCRAGHGHQCDGVVGKRSVDGVQVSCAQGHAIHGVVGVAGGAGAVRHLAKTTIDRVVGKGDVGETLSGIWKKADLIENFVKICTLTPVSRGNIRGGRDPACWEGPGPRCSITPRTSHVPAGPAAHVTAASGMPRGAERRSSGVAGTRWRVLYHFSGSSEVNHELSLSGEARLREPGFRQSHEVILRGLRSEAPSISILILP